MRSTPSVPLLSFHSTLAVIAVILHTACRITCDNSVFASPCFDIYFIKGPHYFGDADHCAEEGEGKSGAGDK